MDTILSLLQVTGILVGAGWAFWRFFIESPTKPRIELDVEAEFLGPQAGQYIAGISIQVRNKGTVNHTIDALEIDIRGLKHHAPVLPNAEKAQRVNFPEEIVQIENIIPGKYQYYFVRAGVQQTIYYHTSVPEDIRFVRVWAAFHYRGLDKKDKHTVERIFEIGPTAGSPSGN